MQQFEQFIWFWPPNSGLYIILPGFPNYCSLWCSQENMHPFIAYIICFSEELPYDLSYCWSALHVLLQINKPYLPLASGEYSFATGAIIVASFSILVPYRFIPFSVKFFKMSYTDKVDRGLLFYYLLQSFWLGWIVGSWPLFWALFISFVLGTAYSINVSSLGLHPNFLSAFIFLRHNHVLMSRLWCNVFILKIYTCSIILVRVSARYLYCKITWWWVSNNIHFFCFCF